MGIVGIIQTRIGLNYLGKRSLILDEIDGEPLLKHLIGRLQRVSSISSIALSIPKNEENMVLCDICKDWGVEVVMGEENDLLGRLIEACERLGGSVIVRVIGESLFIEPSIVGEMIRFHLSRKLEATFARGFPAGVTPDILNLDTLKRIRSFKPDSHPIKFIKDYPQFFKVGFFDAPTSFHRNDLNLSIVSEEDLAVARDILKRFKGKLREYLESEYDLPFINRIERSIKGLGLEDVKKILLIRSNRMRWVNYTIRACKRVFKECEISLLTQSETLEEVRKNSLIDEVIPYGDGFFNIFDQELDFLDRLREKRFDLFLILYNNPKGEGYQFIEAFAHFINPKYVLSLSPGGEVFLLFRGYEDSSQNAHILFLDISHTIDKHLSLVERIWQAAKEFSISFLAHPSWISYEELSCLKDYTCIEIYTRKDPKPEVHSRESVKRWDLLLSQGKRIWGVATDDSHSLLHQGGRAWIMVRTNNFTRAGILAAIRRGSFYSSTGVEILDISFKENLIQIYLKNPARVDFIGRGGRVLKRVTSDMCEYEIRGDEGYVRVEVTDGALKGWTQPFILKDSEVYNPYNKSGLWFKGNTHTHTKSSDGQSSLEDVIEFYIKRGYHFLVITDHEKITI